MGDYGNVQKAYNKARKCKRHRKDVLIFTKDKEENLDKVREDILNLAYEPSEYHYFKVYEPKERQIMALPFYDRVVQHAINNVLEPIFDKRFISQSYACRKGKGMHAASDTLKEWLYEWNKYHPDQPLYAIKADIHHYFQSIDHAILKAEIRKVIKDAGVLALLDRIIDHNGNMPDGVGIPVGNLTSQLFANIYLDALDQFIKHELGVVVKVAVIGLDGPVVHEDEALGRGTQKMAVMRDDQHCALRVGERDGQGLARLHVEVVRRFVEHQNVGLAPGEECERKAGLLAARHRADGGRRKVAREAVDAPSCHWHRQKVPTKKE